MDIFLGRGRPQGISGLFELAVHKVLFAQVPGERWIYKKVTGKCVPYIVCEAGLKLSPSNEKSSTLSCLWKSQGSFLRAHQKREVGGFPV